MVLVVASRKAAHCPAIFSAVECGISGYRVVAVVMRAPIAAVHLLLIGLLLLGALWLPLPLYLVSLALFGLPHVVWEMGFLRCRYAGRWPRRWWLALWIVLLVQGCVRGAVWLGAYSSVASQIVDLLSLLVLGLIVAAAPAGVGWRVRSAGLIVTVGVWLLLERGKVLEALLVLSILHNFSPLAMVWDMARDRSQDRGIGIIAMVMTGLFLLPLLLAFSGWSGAIQPAVLAGQMPLLQTQWPAQWGTTHQQAILSAIVLAQCLHYYSVIVLLPHMQQQRTGEPVLPRWARFATWATVALTLIYYAMDYRGARNLYAVVAGIHAWLEWPVLLMACLSMPDRLPAVRSSPGPAI